MAYGFKEWCEERSLDAQSLSGQEAWDGALTLALDIFENEKLPRAGWNKVDPKIVEDKLKKMLSKKPGKKKVQKEPDEEATTDDEAETAEA